MNQKICEQCETVSHCLKHGCIPVTALPKEQSTERAKLKLPYKPEHLTEDELRRGLARLDASQLEQAAPKADRAVSQNGMFNLIKDAYEEGWHSNATYNDVSVVDFDEEWGKSRAFAAARASQGK